MRHHRLFFTIVCLFIFFSLSAQKGILKQANKYYQAGKYLEALELYDQVKDKNLNDNILFKRGVSNYYANKIDEAILDFSNARRMGYEEKEIYLYAANALHSKKVFDDASRFYKNYLRYVEDDQEKIKVVRLIKQCKFGLDNQYNEQLAFVENLGSSVNTEYDEVNPVQSPTSQNKYYFSSNRSGSHGGLRNSSGYKDEIYGNYSADMYAVELSGGNWTPASAFHPILNGPKNDLIEGFNPDGSVMYFLKSQDGNTGQMYSDTFSIDKDPEAFPKQFASPIIAELGDKDMQVFNNNAIIFASKRKGGYGGYDIYITLKKDGEWNVPINLGPEVNSQYDEVTPFLAKSGTKLYFSTNRIESFGSFDIYYSEFNGESNSWSTAANMGIPINSTMEDKSFSLSSDGMTAIFSSNRPESLGGKDLFLAYFKNQVTDQLMYTEDLPFVSQSDKVVADGQAIETTKVNNNSNIDENPTVAIKEFINNALFYGNDEIIMNPSNTSKMKKVKDLMLIYPELEVTFSGHSTKEGMREFDLYFSIKRAEKAAKYLVQNGINANRITVKGLGSNFPHTMQSGSTISSLAERNNRRIDIAFSNVPNEKLRIIEERPSVSAGLKDPTFEKYINTISDLAYKIQIATTKQMYKADVIRQYNSGIIEKQLNDDNYRYTIGVFESYKDARNLKSELIRKGILEAKVVPYVNDQNINSEQVQALKDIFTDLNDYLKFESE